MRYLPVWAMILASLSCATPLHKNLNTSEGKKAYCAHLGETAGTVTVTKWALQGKIEAGEISADDGWRVIALLAGEDLADVGFSSFQIETFVREIYSIVIMKSFEYDIVSHHKYAEISCLIEQNGGSPKSLEESIPSLRKCWDEDQELDTDICFEKVISKETQMNVGSQ